MGLFNKRKKEMINERTELEKTFEEKGQQLGKDTGEFVQKGITKINELKGKYDANEKIEKVKGFADKTEQRVGKLVGKATKKRKDVVEKLKKK